ncbi:hypothetical protein BGX27_008639 [Mortierella sp. AM989]|nr:hypothetical protein BGX27_008639 [Mortierella sp. AM989]
MAIQVVSLTEAINAPKFSPKDLVIEKCTREQAQELFYSWAQKEQWNPCADGQTIKVFHDTDPEGFLSGKINEDGKDVVVSIITAIRFRDDQAWVGYYIASPEYRGRGYGIETFNKALEHVGHDRQSVGLDGVMAQVHNYKKSGFTEVAWQNDRRHGSIKDLIEHREQELTEKIIKSEIPGLVNLSDDQVDLEQLPGIEERFTGLKRPDFVKNWAKFHTDHPELHRFGAAVLSTDGTKDKKSDKPIILGYGCVRPAENSYRVGPLFASTPEIAKLLLVKLACEVEQAEKQNPNGIPLDFDVDVPNSNQDAVKYFDSIGWNGIFPSLRMWKGKIPAHDVNGVYGVTSLEVG